MCKLTETEVKLERNLQVNKTRSLELDLGNLGLEMPQVSLECYDRKYHCFRIKKQNGKSIQANLTGINGEKLGETEQYVVFSVLVVSVVEAVGLLLVLYLFTQ